MIVEHMIHLRV
uniref:Rna polymerase ii second largest subunit n=1 Tax=Triatoma infestans TaxID=30076 RepID=A0A170YNH5_TRIIF